MFKDMKVLVLYGSQTGCAADVARRVYREARRMGFSITLSTMDDFPIAKLPQQDIVLFICSTTGQGQVPDNMSRFWKFLLRSDLPPGCLRNIQFSVFGLGDQSYPLYNAVARRLQQRLIHLGATEFSPIGLGDDQHAMGYDGGLIPWLSTLWIALSDLVMERLGVLYTNDSSDDSQQIARLEHVLDQLSVNINVSAAADQVQSDDAQPHSEGDSAPLHINYLAAPSVCVHVIRHKQLAPGVLDSIATRHPYIGQPIDPFTDTIQNYYEYSIPPIYEAGTDSDPSTSMGNHTPTEDCIAPQITMSTSMKRLPLLNAFPLTAPANPQIVDHIAFDCTSLISPTQPHTLSSSSPPSQCDSAPLIPIDDLVANPPYLPGDVLEVVAPNCNALVNATLSLYNLHPNDIICIHRQDTIYDQTIENDGLYLLSNHFPPQHDFTSTDSSMRYHAPPGGCGADSHPSITMNPLSLHEIESESPPVLSAYPNFPRYIRAWHLFTWYSNLIITPQRHIFFLLAQLASDPLEKERLSDLCTVDYASTLDSYCIRERRSIIEVLTDFPSAVIPLNWLIELFDRLKPRQFSISSSPLYDQVKVDYMDPATRILQRGVRLSQLVPSASPFSNQLQYLPNPPSLSQTDIPHSQCGDDQQHQQQQCGAPPSSNNHPHPSLTASVCLGIVEYITPFKRKKTGVCSMYLHQQARFAHQYQVAPTLSSGSDQPQPQPHDSNTPDVKSNNSTNNRYDPRNDGYTINIPFNTSLLEGFISHPHVHTTSSSPDDIPSHCNPTTNTTTTAAAAAATASTLGPWVMGRIKPGSFRYDITETQPLMLIGPGTGVAAFHAIAEHRMAIHAYFSSFDGHDSLNHILGDPACVIGPSSGGGRVFTSKPGVLLSLPSPLSSPTQQQQGGMPPRSHPQPPRLSVQLEPVKVVSDMAQVSLLFGSRYSDGDHYYRDFFNYCVRVGVLTHYHAVYSRKRTCEDPSQRRLVDDAYRVLYPQLTTPLPCRPVTHGVSHDPHGHGGSTGHDTTTATTDLPFQTLPPSHYTTNANDDDNSDYMQLEQSHRKRGKSSPSLSSNGQGSTPPSSSPSQQQIALLSDTQTQTPAPSSSSSALTYPPPPPQNPISHPPLAYIDGTIMVSLSNQPSPSPSPSSPTPSPTDTPTPSITVTIDGDVYLPFSTAFEKDQYVQHRLARKALREYLTTRITTAVDTSFEQQILSAELASSVPQDDEQQHGQPKQQQQQQEDGDHDPNGDSTEHQGQPEIPISGERGVVIVAGNAKKMPVDVQLQITYIIAHVYKLTEENARKYVNQLARSGRYLLECWT